MAHEVTTYDPTPEEGLYQLCRASDLPIDDDLHLALRKAVLEKIDKDWPQVFKRHNSLLQHFDIVYGKDPK